MTRQVRRLAGFTLLLFGALFVNLNVVQLLKAEELANHPANRRLLIEEYEIDRGPIIIADEAVATSEPTEGDLKYLRRYEPATLYAHLMGYYSVVYGRDGLERTMNEALTGTPTEALAENLTQLLGAGDRKGNRLRLTMLPEGQQAAMDALGDRAGAIVALDPRSGAVLVHASNPTYDPNRLSSHDPSDIRAYWEQLQQDPAQPLADRAIERRYNPGSTMKLLVAAAALERGFGRETTFPDEGSYQPPQTDHQIGNFGGGTCTGGGTITLERALIVSCNTVFARLGVELGDDALIQQSERFGFNRQPPYALPVAESRIPKELDPPTTAQAAIGGFEVQATALQMAMVAGAITNQGVLMKPYAVAEVLDPSGRRVRGPDSGPWVQGSFTAQAVSRQTADTLRQLMIGVVEEGTGRRAQVEGAVVGGKTGTADPGSGSPHAWFVGFLSTPDEGGNPVPRAAIAVVLPDAGEGATGGGDAAPIAQAVLSAIAGTS